MSGTQSEKYEMWWDKENDLHQLKIYSYIDEETNVLAVSSRLSENPC
jgi:hypothetical protein